MAGFGTSYNPTAVAMGRNSGGPYLWSGRGNKPPTPGPAPGPGSVGPVSAGGPFSGSSPATPPTPPAAPAAPTTPPNTLAPESIRATGTGPFDPQYRQNLATYAGGQFSRPSGGLNFNPTDPTTFPGQPTGGGSAPVTGMPSSLMDMALGGQGFSWTPPPAAQTATSPGNFQTMQQWMNQFLMNGRNGRMGSIA